MEQVDSKIQQLSIDEVLQFSVNAFNHTKLPPYALLLAFVKEATLPNTEVELIGNTLFITHFSKDGVKAIGRAYNADTAQNLIMNGDEYMKRLYKKGVRRFSTQIQHESFAFAFNVFKSYPITSEMDVQIIKKPSGNTLVFIKLDGELL